MYGEVKPAKELFINSFGEYESISYEYFMPNLLDIGFNINNPEIYLMMGETIKAITELNADSKNLKDTNIFLRMIINQEAVKSSSIEGTKTTFSEIVVPEMTPNNEEAIKDWEEVNNYVRATFKMQSELVKLPICERFISNLHKTLLTSVRGSEKKPGEIRKVQNWIGGNSIRSPFFVPPHQNELKVLMKDLCEFWHNKETKLPDLIKIALFHYQFETIHPFEDGNGRIGRLMILAQLLDCGLLSKPWFNVSYVFERNKVNYTQALRTANKTGDLDSWIMFFLDSLLDAAKNTYKLYHEFNKLQNECSAQILELGAKAKNAHLLLDELYSFPSISISEIADVLDVTYQTAKNLADDMIRLGLVEPFVRSDKLTKKQQAIIFRKYINLFE